MTKNKPTEPNLGRSIIKARFPNRRITKQSETTLQQIDTEYRPNPNSIIELTDLDDFVYQATLAGATFTGERMSTQILTDAYVPGTVASEQTQLAQLSYFQSKKDRLRIPRRPDWNEFKNAVDCKNAFDEAERESFLKWRRELADLVEVESAAGCQHAEFTPFEKNIEIWRQLWRVVDRADLLVQIVDARNPLLYYCEDLVKYVHEVSVEKRCMLLVNKADLLNEEQRNEWMKYFVSEGIEFVFYSALNSIAAEKIEESKEIEQTAESNNEESKQGKERKTIDQRNDKKCGDIIDDNCDVSKDAANPTDISAVVNSEIKLNSSRILSSTELTSLFTSISISNSTKGTKKSQSEKNEKCIGLVGYPNVGKSSTINSIFNCKKVAVAATPGKTKHFQTLWLTPSLLICDCPGLVFPNFTSCKAELVVNGILPIDQARDYVSPASLVAQRIPREYLEYLYGIYISKPALQQFLPESSNVPTPAPSGSELLSAYALMRGFRTGVYGAPDESRAARVILKDYVNGKLLFCHPPPSYPSSAAKFNAEIYRSLITERSMSTAFQSRLQFQEKQSIREHGDAKTLFDDSFFAPAHVSLCVKGGERGRLCNRSTGNGSNLTVKDLPKKHYKNK